jgi:hypothetical protein
MPAKKFIQCSGPSDNETLPNRCDQRIQGISQVVLPVRIQFAKTIISLHLLIKIGDKSKQTASFEFVGVSYFSPIDI